MEVVRFNLRAVNPGTSRVYFDQLSRIDFDDYYEPSDFVDRAYGDIDGSAAGGEVL